MDGGEERQTGEDRLEPQLPAVPAGNQPVALAYLVTIAALFLRKVLPWAEVGRDRTAGLPRESYQDVRLGFFVESSEKCPDVQLNPPCVFGDSIFWKDREYGTADAELQPRDP